ncbi:MAG: hypothetical protein N3A61_08835 [Ignavibacteria bacterium]|nr:hypothetical protein [Ignavibacteria bacterium]
MISAIGAALGIIRDSIEKTIINPTDADIIALRQEARDSVQAMGAKPESIEVSIEIDSKNKRVIAVATGSSELRTRDLEVKILNEEELLKICAASFRTDVSNLVIRGKTPFLYAVTHLKKNNLLFGLFRDEVQRVRVIDREGTIKLQINDCLVEQVNSQIIKSKISEMIQSLTTFGDAGALLPDIYILVGAKIVDLTGLILESQIMTLVDLELEKISPDEPLVIITAKKK